MICPNCNNENKENALVCENCGYKFEKSTNDEKNTKKQDSKNKSLEYNFGKENKNSPKSKKIIIVVSIIGAIIIGLGIFYLVSPSKFMKAILGESKYTQYVLAKNMKAFSDDKNKSIIKTYMDAKYSYDFDTNLDVEFDNKTEGADKQTEEIEKAILEYLNTLKVSGNTTKQGTITCNYIKIDDNNGKITSLKVLNDNAIGSLDKVENMYNFVMSGASFRNVVGDFISTEDTASSLTKSSPTSSTYFMLGDSNKWVTSSSNDIMVGDINKVYQKNKDTKKQNELIAKGIGVIIQNIINDLDSKNCIKIESNKTIKSNDYSVTGDNIVITLTSKQVKDLIGSIKTQVKENEDIYNGFKAIYDSSVKKDDALKNDLNSKFGKMSKNDYKKIVDELFAIYEEQYKGNHSDFKVNININNRSMIQAVELRDGEYDGTLIIPCGKNKDYSFNCKTDDFSFNLIAKNKGKKKFDVSVDTVDNNSKDTSKIKFSINNLSYYNGVLVGKIDGKMNLQITDQKNKDKKENIEINFMYDTKKKDKDMQTVLKIEKKGLGKVTFNGNLKSKKFKDIELPTKENTVRAIKPGGAVNEEYTKINNQYMEDVMSGLVNNHPDLLGIFMIMFAEV